MLDELWEGEQNSKRIWVFLFEKRGKDLGFPDSMLIFIALNYNILKQIKKNFFIYFFYFST